MSVRITTLNENTVGMVNLLANSIMPVPYQSLEGACHSEHFTFLRKTFPN
jgi:hypothetical protein